MAGERYGKRERAKLVLARQAGIVTVEAEIPAKNRGVVRLTRDCGFRPRSSVKGGPYHGDFPIPKGEPARQT